MLRGLQLAGQIGCLVGDDDDGGGGVADDSLVVIVVNALGVLTSKQKEATRTPKSFMKLKDNKCHKILQGRYLRKVLFISQY